MVRARMAIAMVAVYLLTGCSGRQRVIAKRDLLKFINDPKHGLVRQQEVNGLTVRVSYEPSSLLVSQELARGGKSDSATIRALTEKYGKYCYFVMEFSRDGKEAIRQAGSFSQYSNMVQVLSFQMGQFINLTTAVRDTVDLADYAFEQTYGMSKANTLLLSFPREKINKADVFEVNLAECGFGVGSLRFPFKRSDLMETPDLDYGKLDRP